jgi:23S rRNA (uracil1939-C5)-methyltransferase
MAPIRSGASALAYRNRLILPLRGGPGGLRAGFFRAYSHSLIDVESCPVQHPALWTAARRTVELLAKSGAPAWDERTGRGVLRHVVARRAAGTGQVGVIIVVNGDGFAGERELAEELLASDPSIRGVSVNTNTSLTNVILGGTTRTVAGRGKLEEEIGGMKLVASHESFFQANHEVTGMMLELLSGWAREAGAGEGGVLDIYCGTGLLGIAAARAAGASRLTGVEEVPAAVDDAGANARANGVAQARFVAGAAAMALPGMLAGQPGPGFVVLDPPRKGAEPEVLSALASLGPPCIAYVSCDPMTFARDLKRLGEGGYRLREVVPFDMFPHTYHVELAARLERAA